MYNVRGLIFNTCIFLYLTSYNINLRVVGKAKADTQ